MYWKARRESYSLVEGINMDNKIKDKNALIDENLRLKKEKEWNKNKIAYLESLLELNGVNPKKQNKAKKEKK